MFAEQAFNAVGVLASCFLSESLAKPLRKPMQMKKMANPVAFVGFFRRSKPLAALAPLLCVWELGSREFLPAQQYRRLKYGWTLREQANMMLAYQVRKFVHLSSEDKGDQFTKTSTGKAALKKRWWGFLPDLRACESFCSAAAAPSARNPRRYQALAAVRLCTYILRIAVQAGRRSYYI